MGITIVVKCAKNFQWLPWVDEMGSLLGGAGLIPTSGGQAWLLLDLRILYFALGIWCLVLGIWSVVGGPWSSVLIPTSGLPAGGMAGKSGSHLRPSLSLN